MNQGSNYKQQVMEALFNAPSNLINNKAIMWAASNLPEEGGLGSHKTFLRKPYNHDSDSFTEAIGLDPSVHKLSSKFKKVFMEYVESMGDEKFSKSMVFEHLEKEGGPEAMIYLTVMGFMRVYDAIQAEAVGEGISEIDIPDDAPDEIKALLRHLEELKKRLGGKK